MTDYWTDMVQKKKIKLFSENMSQIRFYWIVLCERSKKIFEMVSKMHLTVECGCERNKKSFKDWLPFPTYPTRYIRKGIFFFRCSLTTE